MEDVFLQGIWSPDFISEIVTILNGLVGLRKLYIDFTLEPLTYFPRALTSPQLALQTSELKPLLSLRGLTKVKLSFAAEAKFSTDWPWPDRERAFWATWVPGYRTYFVPHSNLSGESQKELAMSFLQGLEAELQKTASLPREAVADLDHFGFIQWKPDGDSSFTDLSPYRSLLPENEDDAESDDAHTTEGEESEDDWFEESDEESDWTDSLDSLEH